MKKNEKLIIGTVLAIGLLLGSGLTLLAESINSNKQASSTEEIGTKALYAINDFLLPPEITASLVGISLESLYRLTVEIDGNNIDLFVTEDGSSLVSITESIDLDLLLEEAASIEEVGGEELDEGGLDQGGLDQEKIDEQPEAAITDFTQEELVRLAKRLSDEGVIFFGTGWCPFCVQQKDMFGEASKYLPYVECSEEHGATEEELAICKEKGVGTVPDWRFPGEEPILGMIQIERLIGLSGCQILQDRLLQKKGN